MQDDRPNSVQILEVVKTTTHIEGVLSPLTGMQPFGRGASSGAYERALSLADSGSDSDSQNPGMDNESQTSLVN